MEQQFAERFEVYAPPNFADQPRKVLYIGKATAGDLKPKDVEWVFYNKHSPFWDFATEISKVTGGDGRSNLAWSNVFKQGVLNGNPRGSTAHDRRDESIEELRQDLQKTKADLIVLVTADYWEEIPKQAFDVLDGESLEDGDKKLKTTEVPGQKYAIWSRGATGIYPPIVWTNHPQGKLNEYRDAAVQVIREVTGWSPA